MSKEKFNIKDYRDRLSFSVGLQGDSSVVLWTKLKSWVQSAIDEKAEREENNAIPWVNKSRPVEGKNVTVIDFGDLKVMAKGEEIIKPFQKYRVTIEEIG